MKLFEDLLVGTHERDVEVTEPGESHETKDLPIKAQVGDPVHGQQAKVGAMEIGCDEVQERSVIIFMKREVVILKIKDSVTLFIALPDFSKNILRRAPLESIPKGGVNGTESASVRTTPCRGYKAKRLPLVEIPFSREIGEIREGEIIQRIRLSDRVQHRGSISLVTEIGHVG
jgi:hypothetical protein